MKAGNMTQSVKALGKIDSVNDLRLVAKASMGAALVITPRVEQPHLKL